MSKSDILLILSDIIYSVGVYWYSVDIYNFTNHTSFKYVCFACIIPIHVKYKFNPRWLLYYVCGVQYS